MYTSTPADVPDPPFRFFEGLVPRLGVADPCRLANLLYSRELIGKDIQKEAQTSQSIHCFKILTLDPCATVVLDISNTKYYPYTLS